MKYSLCHDFLNSKKIIYPLAKYAPSYLAGKHDFAPWSVEIHPTAKCNHRCIHCSYKERNESRVEMPREVFDHLVDSMIAMHVHGVYFSGGGEPCAYPGLAAAVKKLHENGVEVALVSNGALFEQMGMMDVADHLNYIALSVPSCDPAMFEKITGRPYLDRVLALPEKIKERYGNRAPVVGSRVVVTNLIAKEVPSILETLKAKAFDYVIFKVVRDYEDRGLGLSEDMVAELREEIAKLCADGEVDHDFTNVDTIFNYRKPYDPKGCCLVNEMGLIAAVSPEGDVYPNICEIGHEAFCIGNVKEQPFEILWNGERHAEVKATSNAQWTKGACKNCRAISYNVRMNDFFDSLPREEDPFI